MSDPLTRTIVLADAEQAYMILAVEVSYLLDVISAFADAESLKNIHSLKIQWVQDSYRPLASLITTLSEAIVSWKNNRERLLSVQGVEIDVLNEIWVHVESLMILLLREQYPLRPFSPKRAEAAVKKLIEVNRVMK